MPCSRVDRSVRPPAAIPTANPARGLAGSISDFTAILGRDTTVEEVRAAATTGPLSKVLVDTEDQIVSSDIVGSPASCTFSPGSTMAMGSLVKVFGWYDNEWGYSNRLVDLAAIVGAPTSGEPRSLALVIH